MKIHPLLNIINTKCDYQWPTNASKTLTTVFGDIRPFRYHTGLDIRTYGINDERSGTNATWTNEIDLDVGNLRFKIGGGHGGNNGVRDIIEKVGDPNFSRLRIGIGHPGSVDKVVSYVLNKPNNDDTENILSGISVIIDEYQNLFQGKIEELMNKNNKRNKKD